MAIEIIKESDSMKATAWDRLHDKRKLYRCERCGAEWKCEYSENKFGKSHEMNGDPDILCPRCGFPTVKEVVLRKMNTIEPLCKNCKLFYTTPKCKYATGPDQYADECHAYKQIEAEREMSEIMDNNENCTTCIHCNLLFNPPVCRINGESLPNPTGRICNKYDKE